MIVALTAVLGLIVTALPADALHSPHGGRYVAADSPVVVWCGAEDHEIVKKVVEGYLGSAWFPGPDENFPWSEPECAHADIANAVAEASGQERSEWGYGGFMWILPPSALGATATIWTEDDVFDESFVTFFAQTYNGEHLAVEGCGPQTMTLPPDLEFHWQSPPGNPLHVIWAFVPNVGIDDDLNVCFGSMGDIWATYGDA